MRIAYIDCFAGIARDMLLAALVDAGVPRSVLEEATAAIELGASLKFETVDRSGICATKVHVLEGDHLAETSSLPDRLNLPPIPDPRQSLEPQRAIGHAHPHTRNQVTDTEPDVPEGEQGTVQERSLTTIRQLIQDSKLLPEVKALAIQTFELLGHSEAKIHNVPVDEIHFHEIGGIDAIIDIVAVSAGIVHLQIDAWHSSPVNVGGGMVKCAHGVFPVRLPPPQTSFAASPHTPLIFKKELVTPTGAALLRALHPIFGPQPAMTVEHVGYGAGTRNPPGFPNVLRLSIGESHNAYGVLPSNPSPAHPTESAQTVTVLETALDDATPQLLAYVTEQALKLGALDVMLTPVIMKKGRPGTMLTLLSNPEDSAIFEQLLLRETTTLGIRVRQDRRICLDRSHTTVETPYGHVRVKTGSLDGQVLNVHPEFEDCRRAAEDHAVPLKQVHAAAMSAYLTRFGQGSAS